MATMVGGEAVDTIAMVADIMPTVEATEAAKVMTTQGTTITPMMRATHLMMGEPEKPP